ncbi:hypothetical protein [Pseudonocardia sp. T1-2H]|uniref:hypothetical protein n=1 Tax=Pseudonocardia sp. T1-2H TaxID=3128899 RepID=UPI00310193DA
MGHPHGRLPGLGRAEAARLHQPPRRRRRARAAAGHHGARARRSPRRRERVPRDRRGDRSIPSPRHLVRLLDRIAPEKDIDALGVDAVRTACATAEGITRIAAPYLEHGASVAVAGSRGFVGSGVLRLLQRAGHEPFELDYGDDLRQVRDVDVIISTTGRAGLLHAEHLHRGHRLVIDSGFVPHPAGPVGDVHPSAAGLPRTVTPVPGGIGPVEMATLAERLVVQVAATELASWRYLALGREAETGLALHHKHTTAELTVAAERARAVEPGTNADERESRTSDTTPARDNARLPGRRIHLACAAGGRVSRREWVSLARTVY